MLYAWLYLRSTATTANPVSAPLSDPCVAGIQPLGRLHAPLLTVSWNGQEIITPEQLAHFEELLTQLLADLLNPLIPFEARPDSPLCKYCPFHETCQAD